MKSLFAAAVLPLFCVLVYLPSLDNPLVWDDVTHVEAARNEVAAVEADDALYAPRPLAAAYRRPMVLASYRAQARLGVDSAAGLHGANIALHAACALLLYALLLRLELRPATAFGGALVFAAHPLTSAAVAYVSGRTDLLATMFTLLALHAARTFVGAGFFLAVLSSLAAAGFTAAAALSKESGLMAAPLVIGMWHHRRRYGRDAIDAGLADSSPLRVSLARAASVDAAMVWVLPGFVGFAAIAAFGFVVPPALEDGAGLDVSTRLAGAGTAVTTFGRLLVAPSDLHLDRLTPISGWPSQAIGAVVAALIVWMTVGFALSPSLARFARAALAWTYLPAAGFIPIYPRIADRMVFTGEQLMYGPLAVLGPLLAAGLALATTRMLARLESSSSPSERLRVAAANAPALAAAICVAIALAGVPLVWARQRVLADPELLYRTTLEHSPSSRACFNLGVTLLARDRLDDARDVYERCTELAPRDAEVWGQLGVVYARQRKREEAARAYGRALELDPRDVHAWSNFAALDAASGLYDEARDKWQHALRIRPGFGPAVRGTAKLDELESGR